MKKISIIILLSMTCVSCTCFLRGPEDRSLYVKGEDSFLQGNFEEAARSFEQYLVLYPEASASAYAHYWTGRAFIKLSRYQLAAVHFERAFKMASDTDLKAYALNGLADTYWEDDKKLSAVKIYRELLQDYSNYCNAALIRDRLSRVTDRSDSSGDIKGPGRVNISGYYYIQAGLFNRKENASQLRDKIVNSGLDAQVEHETITGVEYFVVKVGHFKDLYEASMARRSLKDAGINGIIKQFK